MITKRLQYMNDAALKGELLEVVNNWVEPICGILITENERLDLVVLILRFLSGRNGKAKG